MRMIHLKLSYLYIQYLHFNQEKFVNRKFTQFCSHISKMKKSYLYLFSGYIGYISSIYYITPKKLLMSYYTININQVWHFKNKTLKE